MGLAFSTSGRVAFRVILQPTQVALSRFANACFRTEARVSHMERVSTKEWSAVVWLRTTTIPQFENLCDPLAFDFMSTRDLIREVAEDPDAELDEE